MLMEIALMMMQAMTQALSTFVAVTPASGKLVIGERRYLVWLLS